MDFDKHFKNTERAMGCMFVLNMILVLAVSGFFAWVIIKLLQFFGVV